MGILETHWEGEFEGHRFTVHRNEVTKGFRLEYDGHLTAKKNWSLIGTGEIEGKIDHGGRELPVKLIIPAFEQAKLFVGDKPVTLKQAG